MTANFLGPKPGIKNRMGKHILKKKIKRTEKNTERNWSEFEGDENFTLGDTIWSIYCHDNINPLHHPYHFILFRVTGANPSLLLLLFQDSLTKTNAETVTS